MSASDIVYKFEFTGSDLEVVESTHQGYEGLNGKVIDETKNVFLIEDEEKEKKIPKKGNRFELTIDGRHNILDGNNLTHRPEDRIKKLG